MMPVGAALAAAAPAIIGGVASSAAGALVSGALQGGSVDSAASQASGISKQAIEQATTNSQPFITAGTGAVGALGNALGLNGADGNAAAVSDFQASPGYQYSVDQGLRTVDSGAAARGMLRSGATLKAEQTLGNNLANQDYGNYLTRLNQLGTLGNNAATSLNGVISGQSTNQQGIITGAGSQDASIYGNVAGGVTSAIKSIPTNGLFSSGTTGTSFGTNGGTDVNAFSGAGTTF
jgi:hypothetical protein